MRKNLILSQLLLIIFIVSCSPQSKKENKKATQTEPSSETVIMAYYVAENPYEPEKIPVEKLTHIIYSFTNVIDGEMKFREPEEAGSKLKALVQQKTKNPDLKVMIACGGWGADGFVQVSPE